MINKLRELVKKGKIELTDGENTIVIVRVSKCFDLAFDEENKPYSEVALKGYVWKE